MNNRRSHCDNGGFATIEWVALVGLSLVFVMFLGNVLFIGYAGAIVRNAADEGARAGAQFDKDEKFCKKRIDETLQAMGGLATHKSRTCEILASDGRMRASVEVTLRPWVPLMPGDIKRKSVAYSVREKRS